MKVLAIGNSFSQDAMRYLHGLAEAAGEDLTCANLYIGGCSLETHWGNAAADAKSYGWQFNGEETGETLSISEGIARGPWDVITLQQASHFSVNFSTYQPFLTYLNDYVNRLAPDAARYIHQTWAYEQGSERLCTELGYRDQADMFSDLKAAYDRASADIGDPPLIPCGAAFQNALAAGFTALHRDTFHASLGAGRYLLSAVWFETLTGKKASSSPFVPFDEEVPSDVLALLQDCAHRAVLAYRRPSNRCV